ncbi:MULTISPECIES: polysaccharide pyruvyl transferase family protein [unclassified Moorena]|uniref:polysaccharide pyruvyl transferase family protein n=1 Tax=unclassified Moorena TaxID=2683338 RepID=UPI0013C7DD64|nr:MULTISPECIES: polysaccharide pyruvyl transferase family protein [unclassified Moorena]NEP31274.1 polysaccharide pyruvyl transferase family protein [Moorena sp. SIO3B2]NES40577.1 polysaccharide pyruvyl transferase family protein [Moorena sp. SIO2C4]
MGCRDSRTVKEFNKINIDAYFSGCPTITLKNPEIERTDEVLVVDAHLKNAAGHIPDTTQLLRSLVPSYILEKAKFLTHNVEPYKYRWHGYKLNRAIDLLTYYAKAKLVITSRLHCALPCLAFGTPCVFIHKNLHTDFRLKDYTNVLNGYDSPSDTVKINWDSPEATDISELYKITKNSIDSKLSDILLKVPFYG